MASYDLVCESCGHRFEVFRQGFIKDEDKTCPECGSTDVRQKYSTFLSALKGSLGGGCGASSGSPFG